MKKLLLVCIFMVCIVATGFATQHTVTSTANFTFSPDSINIEVGDTVVFSLASFHNAVQVDKATWDANGTTPLVGGFSLPLGGGTVHFTAEGKVYYVCTPHAFRGMKGVIVVGSVTPVTNINNESPFVNVFPNPATSYVTVSYTLDEGSAVSIRLLNSAGMEVGEILHEAQGAGKYQTTFPLNGNLAKGAYFIVMNSNQQTYVKSLIVQ
jgi:plastocyanin